jgi:hypothetical protein
MPSGRWKKKPFAKATPISFNASTCPFFDAFRDDRRAELIREKTYALYQLTVATGDAINELFVDLDVVKWEALQQRDVAALGSEISDGNCTPWSFEPRYVVVEVRQFC